jgi:hypothetical protein
MIRLLNSITSSLRVHLPIRHHPMRTALEKPDQVLRQMQEFVALRVEFGTSVLMDSKYYGFKINGQQILTLENNI